MNYHCFKSYDLTNQSESSLKVAMTTPYICTSRLGVAPLVCLMCTDGYDKLARWNGCVAMVVNCVPTGHECLTIVYDGG